MNELNTALENVFVKSNYVPNAGIVQGYDFNNGVDFNGIISSYKQCGFQATNLGLAIEIINEMINARKEVVQNVFSASENAKFRSSRKCTIFLGYTSNMSSSGVHEILCFLAQHDMIDCIVTTAGGIEEDLIKCLAPFYIGDFNLNGANLRENGLNRIGNLLVPNDNYCQFQDWILPIFDQMLVEQKQKNTVWTPSKIIVRLGKEINHLNSICYWAGKNGIPIFSPAITDGSIGDMLFFHSYKNPGLIIDILEDLNFINSISLHAESTGMIVLGGGLIKHHICNANLMRNGANYSVYINTGQEFDGSDSGASPDEAISWGKIRPDAKSIKIFSDATLVFPLIVAETFAKQYFSNMKM